MKKKVLALVLAVIVVAALAIGLVACNPNAGINELTMPAYEDIQSPDYSTLQVPENFKIGIICLHGEESTYDKNFIDAARRAISELGLSNKNIIFKTGIKENSECLTAARELVEAGCSLIFADSFGHEEFMSTVAKENPNVQFCHATGTTAHTNDAPANLHNAFASIYEGRYLAGIVAGMKLNEMIAAGKFTADQAKMGYVGAYTYEEVISGYTSFYLGAKSVCPTVTMEVQFTGSWFNISREKSAAEALIANGCKLISQHADSMGSPSACEEAGVPNVSYNGSTIVACPETFLVSSSINWTPYFKYIIAQTVNNEAIADDWLGTIATGSVVLTNLNADTIADGTLEAVIAARTKLAKGELSVFDCTKFTVDGKAVTTFTFEGQEVIENGVFRESYFRSAPYFGLRIDGIKLINEIYDKETGDDFYGDAEEK